MTDPNDGLPGNNMLLGYGDEIEFKRGIGTWWNDGEKYQLEYPFNEWYFNNTTGRIQLFHGRGNTLYPGNGNLINSSSAKNVIRYNVTLINKTGDHYSLHNGTNNIYDNMWIFNVTSIGPDSTTIAMSYKGWPWTMPDSGQGSPGPNIQTFILKVMNWWFGGLDFKVETIYPGNNTVILRLNRPVMIAKVNSAARLMDNNPSNGELKKMRGSVNKVTFNGMDYLVYGYEDDGKYISRWYAIWQHRYHGQGACGKYSLIQVRRFTASENLSLN